MPFGKAHIHPPGQQSDSCFDVPVKSELQALVRARCGSARFKRDNNPRKRGRSALHGRFTRSDLLTASAGLTKRPRQTTTYVARTLAFVLRDIEEAVQTSKQHCLNLCMSFQRC